MLSHLSEYIFHKRYRHLLGHIKATHLTLAFFTDFNAILDNPLCPYRPKLITAMLDAELHLGHIHTLARLHDIFLQPAQLELLIKLNAHPISTGLINKLNHIYEHSGINGIARIKLILAIEHITLESLVLLASLPTPLLKAAPALVLQLNTPNLNLAMVNSIRLMFQQNYQKAWVEPNLVKKRSLSEHYSIAKLQRFMALQVPLANAASFNQLHNALLGQVALIKLISQSDKTLTTQLVQSLNRWYALDAALPLSILEQAKQRQIPFTALSELKQNRALNIMMQHLNPAWFEAAGINILNALPECLLSEITFLNKLNLYATPSTFSQDNIDKINLAFALDLAKADILFFIEHDLLYIFEPMQWRALISLIHARKSLLCVNSLALVLLDNVLKKNSPKALAFLKIKKTTHFLYAFPIEKYQKCYSAIMNALLEEESLVEHSKDLLSGMLHHAEPQFWAKASTRQGKWETYFQRFQLCVKTLEQLLSYVRLYRKAYPKKDIDLKPLHQSLAQLRARVRIKVDLMQQQYDKLKADSETLPLDKQHAKSNIDGVTSLLQVLSLPELDVTDSEDDSFLQDFVIVDDVARACEAPTS